MHELDRHVPCVGARRRRLPERDQPAPAGEALRHQVAEIREPTGLGLEESQVRRGPALEQILDLGGGVDPDGGAPIHAAAP